MKILQYQESFGPVRWQEGFPKELEGLTPEEQLRCYAFSGYPSLAGISYRDLEAAVQDRTRYPEGLQPIPDYWYAIVRDGTVVGVALDRYTHDEKTFSWVVSGQMPLLPYESYESDSSSDNNGSGCKSGAWYTYLVCLPAGHTLW